MPYAAFVPSLTAILGAGVTTGKVQEEGAMGSSYATVPTVNVTPQADGSVQVLCGTYTLRHVNVPPIDQLGWRITQVAMIPGQAHHRIQRIFKNCWSPVVNRNMLTWAFIV